MKVTKGILALSLTGCMVFTLTACGTQNGTNSKNSSTNGTTTSSTNSHGKWVIALSNAYDGNSWRHQMVAAFTKEAKQAKSEGLISNYIIENADNTSAQQISQMNDLILQHVNAIAIDAASSTALNGVIAKAKQAGIKVVTFDSLALTPNAYQLAWNMKKYGTEQTNYVVNRLHGKGNVLFVRGPEGSQPDVEMFNTAKKILSKYPNIKVVGSVYGQASDSVAESAVSGLLPSLPKVDAVICLGGSYGIEQAFQQAGKPIPIIVGNGESNFLHWWYQEHQKNGYTDLSVSTAPGVGGAAFWLALDILNGKNVPKTQPMPLTLVTQSNLKQYSNLPPNYVVSPNFTEQWVAKNLLH